MSEQIEEESDNPSVVGHDTPTDRKLNNNLIVLNNLIYLYNINIELY